MAAYYNEIEPVAAHVLRALIAEKIIAPGEVDTRSIKDVQPDDLKGFTQCHFFAGGGLWSVAARMAGWPDDRPLWTGSCPCQPFSVAGKGLGTADDRHLWPHFHRLIAACKPAVCVGEQVSGKAGYAWLDGVRSDLEGENYTCEAFDIPACAVDAPHIRQRLYWVAMADASSAGAGRDSGNAQRSSSTGEISGYQHRGNIAGGIVARSAVVGDPDRARPLPGAHAGIHRGEEGGRPRHGEPERSGELVGHAESLGRRGRRDGQDGGRRELASADTGAGELHLAHADDAGRQGRPVHAERPTERSVGADGMEHAARERWREGRPEHGVRSGRPAIAGASCWSDAELRIGADGKARRVKPGLRLLVDGLPGRVGLLRIGGNAIVAPLAAEVLAAILDGDDNDIFL